MTSDSDMPPNLPTNRWVRQQHSAGVTAPGFVGSLVFVAANDEPVDPKAQHVEFARRLVARMTRYGITATAIKDECGVDEEAVRLWMRGKRMPKDDNLKRLAKMLGVDAAVLRYGEETPAKMPQLKGEHVTDDDELALLLAYRGIKKAWAREALRRRAVELLEEFGEKGATNPWGKTGGTQ